MCIYLYNMRNGELCALGNVQSNYHYDGDPEKGGKDEVGGGDDSGLGEQPAAARALLLLLAGVGPGYSLEAAVAVEGVVFTLHRSNTRV